MHLPHLKKSTSSSREHPSLRKTLASPQEQHAPSCEAPSSRRALPSSPGMINPGAQRALALEN